MINSFSEVLKISHLLKTQTQSGADKFENQAHLREMCDLYPLNF